MMESMESCVPPGFRFHPTDEELVGYYLRKKVASQKIDLDVIREIDLYRIEPWDLQERCRIGYEEQNEWYFFSHKDKKYPTGTRTNRATMAGFWKATGRDKAVYDKTKLIGMRKTLVFYKGRAPNGQKTDWIMHEYRLESDENGPPQEEGWVVCRAFKKKTNGQMKSMEGWDSSYLLDQETTHFISSHPHHTHTHHHTYNSNLPQNNNYNNNNMCKQEIEVVDNLTCFINSSSSDQFIQHLPQLQSPCLPLIKTPSTSLVSLISNNINNNEEEEEEEYHRHDKTITNKVTDWRALDKFVASQLSQDHHTFETHPNCSNNNVNTTSSSNDMSLLLLHSTTNKVADHIQEEEGEEEGNKYLCLSPFLNTRSSSDCDIGICVFDK